MSLTKCLKKHKAAFSKAEADALKAAAAEYRSEGMAARDAARQAVIDQIQDTHAQTNSVRKQLGLPEIPESAVSHLWGEPSAQYALAYHGTPKRGIEQFDWEKHQLTGEGAAAFGAGTYFTQTKGVGEQYRKELSGDGKLISEGDVYYKNDDGYWEREDSYPMGHDHPLSIALDAVYEGKPRSYVEKIVKDNPEKWANSFYTPLDFYDDIERGDKGQLYEVDIPEADELLDWDKPLSEQPAGVREKFVLVLKELGYLLPKDKGGPRQLSSAFKALVNQYGGLGGEATGESLYRALTKIKGSPEAASQYLRSIGIPGHRYLDGMSRGKGDGSHNFVIYDDSRAKITKTFYSLAETAGAAPNEVEEARRMWAEMGTESPYFKKWFGDSKVVDKDGKPLVVYHGTGKSGFSVFMRGQGGYMYFTPDPEYANRYAGKEGGVYNGFLSMKNPLDLTYFGDADVGGVRLKDYLQEQLDLDMTGIDFNPGTIPLYNQIKHPGFKWRLQDLGFDGVKQIEGGAVAYLAFEPEQFKSATGNRGTFDANDPDIRYSLPFSDPQAEAAYQEGQKGIGDPRGFTARFKEKLGVIAKGFTRHFQHLPVTREFAKAHEWLRQLEQAPSAAQKTSIDWLHKMVGELSRQEYDLFNRKVFLDDMAFDIQEGRTLPDGFTAKGHATDLAAVDAAVANSPKVQKALAERGKIHDEIKNLLVKHGIMDKDQFDNPAYFRHEILKYAREWQFAQGSGKRLNKPKPGYAKERKGSEEMYSTNFLEVEFAYLHRALVDVETEKTITKIKDTYDRKADAAAAAAKWNNDALIAKGRRPAYMTAADKRAVLGDTFRTWRDYIPDGYEVFQPSKGLLYLTGNSITDAAVQELMDGVKLPGTADKAVREALDGVREALMVAGKKPELLLPKELAAQLEALKPKTEDSFFQQALAESLGVWKQWQLFNPRRWAKYNLNNMFGDIDGVLAAIRATEYGKFAAQAGPAIKELYAVARRRAEPSDTYKLARAAGVLDSGLTVGEIPEISKLGEFDKLVAKETGKGAILAPLRAYWRAAQGSSEFRESWMRYTAFKYYLTELEKGRTVKELGYGASHPDLVDGLDSNADKAALLARDLLIDYGAISTYGSQLRNKVFPFYSWLEGNMKRYTRIFANSLHEGPLEGLRTGGVIAGALGARLAAYTAIRAGLVMALISLWNNLMYPDEEKELGTVDRLQLHLILGRDDSGKIQTMRLQGALSDYLGWLGFPEVVGVLEDVQKGKASWGDALKTVAKAPVNKIWGGFTPIVKTPLEAAVGYSTYPDVFKPTKIPDKARYLAKAFSLDSEYDALMNKVEGRPMKDSYLETWKKALIYEQNVGEINYRAVRDNIEKWKEAKGIESAGWSTNPKAELAKQLRLAVKWNDQEAADKIRERMKTELGIPDRDIEKTLKQGLFRAAPLAGVSAKEREEFLATLSPREKEQLKKAVSWYKDTYLDSTGLEGDFYLHEVGLEARQDKKKFDELAVSGHRQEAAQFARDTDLGTRYKISAALQGKLSQIEEKRKKIDASPSIPETVKAKLMRDLDSYEEKLKSTFMQQLKSRGVQPQQ